MFVYCICPDGKLKSNFIKIGSCTKIESLKKRYGTYYGSSNKSYYIKINNKISLENIVHKKLKDLNLHIENELFIYNEIYDFDFYIKQINKIYFETIIEGNYCIHKYTRGKKEGSYCAEEIENNNCNKIYLCFQHDKNYICKKKNIEKIEEKENNDKLQYFRDINKNVDNVNMVSEFLKLNIK